MSLKFPLTNIFDKLTKSLKKKANLCTSSILLYVSSSSRLPTQALCLKTIIVSLEYIALCLKTIIVSLEYIALCLMFFLYYFAFRMLQSVEQTVPLMSLCVKQGSP